MSPPFVVRVQRPDGSFWYSASTTPVTTRGFVTINITGLTDKISNYVADAAGLSGGAAAVTPAVLAANAPALPAAIAKVNTGVTAPMVYAGLDPVTFNAVATPYQAVRGENTTSCWIACRSAGLPATRPWWSAPWRVFRNHSSTVHWQSRPSVCLRAWPSTAAGTCMSPIS